MIQDSPEVHSVLALQLDRICDLSQPVVFYPVRHHSPACARLLIELIHVMKPAAVLIEGPADFNPHLAELALPHELPIAIYSYVRLASGQRRGAFYPFCEYSPEWQAMVAARAVEAAARFIDLPWSELATVASTENRYADAELRRSRYVENLCLELGVDDFNALWDTLCEIDPELPLPEYLRRAHGLCAHIRLADGQVAQEDRRREAFMAAQIERAQREFAGPVLVVTGGYHSYALFARLQGLPFVGIDDPASAAIQPVDECVGEVRPRVAGAPPAKGNHDAAMSGEANAETNWGISLTPYSYERLDSLRGYEAGMPNPGFYHQVWNDRRKERADALPGGSKAAATPPDSSPQGGLTYRRVLAGVARRLRDRGQTVSTADWIAVETTALGLAALRAHAEVWRWDLVDAAISALVKEELATCGTHPFLEAIHDALRGERCGRLAAGARVPPLVLDVKNLLASLGLEPAFKVRDIELDLHRDEDLKRSHVLHRLRLLGIAGFQQVDDLDLAQRDDPSRIGEQWRLQWSPALESSLIEAARYGPQLLAATEERLLELALGAERDAEGAAVLLLDAVLAGIPKLRSDFQQQLLYVIRQDTNFFANAAALQHILYLYRYDEAFTPPGGDPGTGSDGFPTHEIDLGGSTPGSTHRSDIGKLLRETFLRSIWLWESLGQVPGKDEQIVRCVTTLFNTFLAAGALLADLRQEYVDIARRAHQDPGQMPLTRGTCWGTLWALGAADASQTSIAIHQFSDPQQLGDFLTGVFALSRETVQRNPAMVQAIDHLLVAYSEADFMSALPALRLAFSYFTPREKHYLATTLRQGADDRTSTEEPAATRSVAPEVAAAAAAWEAELFATLQKYGLRGGSVEESSDADRTNQGISREIFP